MSGVSILEMLIFCEVRVVLIIAGLVVLTILTGRGLLSVISLRDLSVSRIPHFPCLFALP